MFKFYEILQLKSIKPQYSPKISYYTFSANMNGFKCMSSDHLAL